MEAREILRDEIFKNSLRPLILFPPTPLQSELT
jgi:hypothetical protein